MSAARCDVRQFLASRGFVRHRQRHQVCSTASRITNNRSLRATSSCPARRRARVTPRAASASPSSTPSRRDDRAPPPPPPPPPQTSPLRAGGRRGRLGTVLLFHQRSGSPRARRPSRPTTSRDNTPPRPRSRRTPTT
eukprot:30472-Pelagococcus_subviridis.AAC.2